ncbi:MAG: L-aspartate oxidase [Planctomycetota bacterium]
MSSHEALRIPAAPGGFDTGKIPALETDVLVVGAGIAGAAAALRAADEGSSVICIAKRPLGQANTAWAKGGIAAVLAENDRFEWHLRDTLKVGAGLTSREVAKAIVDKGPKAYDWLVSLGTQFDNSEDGAVQLGREGGHSTARIVHAGGDATGLEIERALGEALQSCPSIQLRLDTFVEDLLIVDGRCVGAIIRESAGQLVIHARAVVLATGGAGQLYRETTNPSGATGDGQALALRAGATLADMEFVQFHPTVLYIAGASRFLISEVVRGAGARLVDRHGAHFMESVHPDAELAPRDVVSRAILKQMVETQDTHVYLDLKDVDGDPRELFPSIARICDAFDLDLREDAIPVRPGAHYVIGGARCDLHGRTDVPGLYVVGEAASSGLHGANRLASNSLLEGAILGLSAGEAAANEPDGPRLRHRPDVSSENLDSTPSPNLHLEDVLYSLKSLMWRQVGVVREAEGLSQAIERIALWNRYVSRKERPSVRDQELRNLLTTATMIATAARYRQESRGTHFRSDFLERDDDNWCRPVLLRRGEGGSLEVNTGSAFEPTDLGL